MMPKVYYHLYACMDKGCFEDANPSVHSQHMRGVHVSSSKPVRVRCPGCGKDMIILGAGDPPKPVIYEQPSQDVQLKDSDVTIDEKILDAENVKP